MSLSDSSATATGCAIAFDGTCTLVTPNKNVVNITNTSDSSTINLGMFYSSNQDIARINVSRYNRTASGWESRSRTNISSSEQSIRLDGITDFVLITHGVVAYTGAGNIRLVNTSNACVTNDEINTTHVSIQDAIDTADPGNIIIVCRNGTSPYTEN